MSFYYQYGSVNGCGDLRGVDNLCRYYAMNLESKKCDNCDTEDNLEWLGEEHDAYRWYCPECKEVCGYEEDEDEK